MHAFGCNGLAYLLADDEATNTYLPVIDSREERRWHLNKSVASPHKMEKQGWVCAKAKKRGLAVVARKQVVGLPPLRPGKYCREWQMKREVK